MTPSSRLIVSPDELDEKDRLRFKARGEAARVGIDPDLYEKQIQQESSFNPRAGSSVGAKGLSQFMPGTGKRYGLHKTEDFYNPDKSLRAGAEHMRDLLKEFGGDYNLALAGYHSGAGAARKAVANPKGNPKTTHYRQTILGNAQPVRQQRQTITVNPNEIQDVADEPTQAPQTPAARPTANSAHLRRLHANLADESGGVRGPASAIVAAKIGEELETRKSETPKPTAQPRTQRAPLPANVAGPLATGQTRAAAPSLGDLRREEDQLGRVGSVGALRQAEDRVRPTKPKASLKGLGGYRALAQTGYGALGAIGSAIRGAGELVENPSRIADLVGVVPGMNPVAQIKKYLGTESTAPEQTPTNPVYQAGQKLADVGATGAEEETTFAERLPRMAGGFAPVIASSAAGPLGPVAMMTAQTRDAVYQDALAKGATEEQAAAAAQAGSVLGAVTGFVPGGSSTRAGASMLKNIGREAALGAGMNAVQRGGENVIARDVAGYDPNRARLEGVPQAAAEGAAIGPMMALPGMMRPRANARPVETGDVAPARPSWLPEGPVGGDSLPLGAEYPAARLTPEKVQATSIQGKLAAGQPLAQADRAFIDAQGQRQVTERIAAKVAEGKPLTRAEQQVLDRQTVPEAPETLKAQIQALKESRGERKAVLVTPGEKPPAGHGLSVVDTAVGRFIYDANKTSARAIRRKVGDGTYHELLGIQEPKSPAATEAVVARTPDGQEAATALASPENVPKQAAELQDQFPDATVTTEPPQKVLEERRYAYRVRNAGEIGIKVTPESHAQATMTLEDARRLAESRSEGPQEIVRIDLDRAAESSPENIQRAGKDWVRFGKDVGEDLIESVERIPSLEERLAPAIEEHLARIAAQPVESSAGFSSGLHDREVVDAYGRLFEPTSTPADIDAFRQQAARAGIPESTIEQALSNAREHSETQRPSQAQPVEVAGQRGSAQDVVLPPADPGATIPPNVGREGTTGTGITAALDRGRAEAVNRRGISESPYNPTRDVTDAVLTRADRELPGLRTQYEAKGAKTPEQQALQLGAAMKTAELMAAGTKFPKAHHRRFGDIQLIGKTPDGAKILFGKVDSDGKGVTYHMAQNPEHELLTNAHLTANADDIGRLPTVSWSELGTLGDAHPPTAVIQALGKKLNLPEKEGRAASKEWRKLSEIPDDVAIEHFPEVFRNRLKEELRDPQWADMTIKQMDSKPQPNEPQIITDWRSDVKQGGLGANRIDLVAKGMAVAAYDTYRDARSFGKWSKQMVKNWGQSIKPILSDLWRSVSMGAKATVDRISQRVSKALDVKAPGQEGFLSVGGTPSTRPMKAKPTAAPLLTPKAGAKDFRGMDWVRSRLSNLDFVGTYERRGGALGRKASDLMRQAQVDIDSKHLTREQAIPQLRKDLNPIIKQFEDAGLPGLAEQLESHLTQVSGKPQPFQQTANLLKGAQYNLRLRFNPKSMIINTLQPLTTLWPHVTTAQFAKLAAEARMPSVRKRLKEKIENAGAKVETGTEKKRIFPDPFAAVSESNRIMGYLHGEKEAKRLGLTGQAAERMAMDWAKKVEFDNSKWDVPPIMSGPVASTLLQFKGFTVKNLESIVNDLKLHEKDRAAGYAARAGKRIISQIAMGGARSLPGVKQIGGIVLVGALAKAFSKAGMDEESANKAAEAVYYGAPALLGEDLSGSLMVIDPPYGNTIYEKLINFAAGPTVSSAARVYQQAGRAMDAKDDESRMKAIKLGVAAVTPYPKMVETGVQIAKGEPVTVRAGDKDEELNKFESVMKAIGFTPVKQTRGYEEKDAFDWQKELMGRPRSTQSRTSGPQVSKPEKPSRPTAVRP